MFGSYDDGEIKIAALYARTSSDLQRERRTIEAQLHYAESYARLHGYHIVETFADAGISGSEPMAERPQGSNLIAAAKRGRFRYVLTYAIDRLARSTVDLLQTHAELKSHGVNLIAMVEGLDTSNPIGELAMTILAAMAQLEREKILERTMQGRARAAREGRWPGGRYPLGLMAGPGGQIVIHEQGARIVRRAFNLYAEGLNSEEIAAVFREEGVPTAQMVQGRGETEGQYQWDSSRIARMLRMSVYRGVHTYAGNTVDVPLIVSHETFDKVQERLDDNTNPPADSAHFFLLRGLVYCGNCSDRYGTKVVGKNTPEGGRAYYYYGHNVYPYRGYPTEEQLNCTHQGTINAHELEAHVWGVVEDFLRNPGPSIEAGKRSLRERLGTLESGEEMERWVAEIREIKNRRSEVLSFVADGLVTQEQAKESLIALKAREDEISESVDKIDARRAAIKRKIKEMGKLEASASWLLEFAHEATDDQRRELIRRLIHRVTITREPEIRVVIEKAF